MENLAVIVFLSLCLAACGHNVAEQTENVSNNSIMTAAAASLSQSPTLPSAVSEANQWLASSRWVPLTEHRADDSLANADYLSSLERDIIIQTNLARTHPDLYITKLERLKNRFMGRFLRIPGRNVIIVTKEGVKAVEEAIQFIKQVGLRPPLSPSRGMSLAAKDHVNDQGYTGTTGHHGSDGSQVLNRVNRYGQWQTIVGENISYGPDSAENVVMQLIVNDGIPNRSHRQNIFKAEYHITGVACGQHIYYKTMCVMTYADDYQERP